MFALKWGQQGTSAQGVQLQPGPSNREAGRYFVASGSGLLHGETSTEWAILRIQIFWYCVIKHLNSAVEHI